MTRGRIWGALALLLGGSWAAGCVVHTYEGPPPERQRRPPPGHGQRPPPPPPPATPAPAPAAPPPGQPAPPPSAPVTPQHAFEDPPPAQSRAQLLPEGAARGRPRGFRPGAPAAYWIWQGPRGGWRVRTTTQSQRHVFRGRLQGTSGQIVNVHAYPVEFRDRIHPTANGWAFSFTTQGHADGFTFGVRDGGCVRFDLKTDGGPEPKRIVVGKGQLQPAHGHFIVCPVGRQPSGLPPGSRQPPRPAQPGVLPFKPPPVKRPPPNQPPARQPPTVNERPGLERVR